MNMKNNIKVNGILYHNKKCSKSREALKYLNESNIDFSTVDYLMNPPDIPKLLSLSHKLKIQVKELIRVNESIFSDLKYKIKDDKTELEWAEILFDNPILIQRPIFETKTTAVIGRPLENIVKLLESISDKGDSYNRSILND